MPATDDWPAAVRAVEEPGVRRAHVNEDRPTSGITPILDRQDPAVRGVNCALQLALPRAPGTSTLATSALGPWAGTRRPLMPRRPDVVPTRRAGGAVAPGSQ